jgi:hypothetical protein
LSPDRKLREASIAFSKINLDVIGHFGGVGQIVPPIFGPPMLPDLSPLFDPIELEYKMITPIVHIEETNTPEALRKYGKYTKHVHVADNTRKQPGTGDIDFTAGLQALKDIGYDGYLSWECTLLGDPKEALAGSVKYVRDILQEIGA